MANVLLYLIVFAVMSGIFILIKSSKENEINFLNETIQRLPNLIFPILKGIPALLAVFYVFLTMPELNLFFILILGGLIFCLFGDLGIMKNLLLGLVLFLVAHILLVIAYSSQIVAFGTQLLENGTVIVAGVLIVLMFLTDLFFYRYLRRSEKPEILDKMKVPVIVYMVLISLHVVAASVFAYNLFLTSMVIVVIVIGSVFFFVSDALIAVHEFHHALKYREIIIMTTYYLAIFFISLITQV
ncbi:MAG: lysoplasmalogenase family protein [Promethearchaeota archaeon]